MMLGILIDRYRFLRAWWRCVTRKRRQAAGLEALFTEPAQSACPIPLPNCETCGTVKPLDPAEVGRRERFGAAILETAAWLEASGWADVEAGERQVLAMWLLERRDAYERGAEVPS
jgi:hypothetical protein